MDQEELQNLLILFEKRFGLIPKLRAMDVLRFLLGAESW